MVASEPLKIEKRRTNLDKGKYQLTGKIDATPTIDEAVTMDIFPVLATMLL